MISGSDTVNGHSNNSNGENNGIPSNPKSPLTNAADLIREIDTAFSDMNTFAASAGTDADEARKNARTAQEVIRLYSNTPTHSIQTASPRMSSSTASPRRRRPPPARPPSRIYQTPSVPQSLEINANETLSVDSHAQHYTPTSKPRTPLSSERLAAAHAEDVLQISLELERSRQRYENEVTSHEDTKAALDQAEERNLTLQRQIESMQASMEHDRQAHAIVKQQLEAEVNRSRERLSAAEGDAQMAMELAKGNATSREQLEGWLKRALQEIEQLRKSRGKMPVPPPPPPRTDNHRMVNFMEEPEVIDPIQSPQGSDASTPSRPTRLMVAAGRKVFQRHLGTATDGMKKVVVASPRDRRRHRAREAVDLSIDTSISSPMKNPMGMAVEAYDALRKTAEMLKQSGQRLKVSGRWWNDSGDDESVHLESLARHYCSSVEVRDFFFEFYAHSLFSSLLSDSKKILLS